MRTLTTLVFEVKKDMEMKEKQNESWRRKSFQSSKKPLLPSSYSLSLSLIILFPLYFIFYFPKSGCIISSIPSNRVNLVMTLFTCD